MKQIVINREMIRRREMSYDECMEKSMSPVQKDVFIIVYEWWKKYGCSPTLRQIADSRATLYRPFSGSGSSLKRYGDNGGSPSISIFSVMKRYFVSVSLRAKSKALCIRLSSPPDSDASVIANSATSSARKSSC